MARKGSGTSTVSCLPLNPFLWQLFLLLLVRPQTGTFGVLVVRKSRRVRSSLTYYELVVVDSVHNLATIIGGNLKRGTMTTPVRAITYWPSTNESNESIDTQITGMCKNPATAFPINLSRWTPISLFIFGNGLPCPEFLPPPTDNEPSPRIT